MNAARESFVNNVLYVSVHIGELNQEKPINNND